MKLKLSVVVLSLCSLTAGLPAHADVFDAPFMVARESSQRDWRDARQERRAQKRQQQQEQQAEQDRARQERESERGYGYGYERRTFERDDVRGRR